MLPSLVSGKLLNQLSKVERPGCHRLAGQADLCDGLED